MDAALFSSPSWFYIDSNGHERGPFRAADMVGWYSDGYFPPHLLVRRSIHSNFIALSSLALAEKSQKSEEKSSEMGQREIKEEYVEREIKEECIKAEIKSECLKSEIKKEYLKHQMEQVSPKLHIKKEGLKSTKCLGSGFEGEYIEPEISKEWLKLESEEECIKTEIKEERIKLEGKDGYIKLDGKDMCIKLRAIGDINFIQLKYREGNTLPQEIANDFPNEMVENRSYQNEMVKNRCYRLEDGEIPSGPGDDVVDMVARGGAEGGTQCHQCGQVPTSLRPLLIPPPPPDAYSAFRPITEYQGDKKRKLAMESEMHSKKKKERVIERDTDNLATFKVNHATVCSTTLWIGHLSKHVGKEDLSTLFSVYGEVNSIDLIRPMGCAYVDMKRRSDAEKALEKLYLFRLDGKRIKIGWAPGKRVKDKDYFDFDLGAFFIPLDKLDSWLTLSTMD